MHRAEHEHIPMHANVIGIPNATTYSNVHVRVKVKSIVFIL